MDQIQEAIEYLESHEAGDNLSYRKVAKIFGVDRTTLSRRHQGKQVNHEAQAERQLLLNPQQEQEHMLYVERCVRRGLPPTREMLQNFAATIANREVSESWVTRFLQRHDAQLVTKWSAGIDRNRHQADSRERYQLYFDLLHSKIQTVRR
jgi:transposase